MTDKLAAEERHVRSTLQLGNEMMHMMNYMTAAIVEPFCGAKVVDRVTAMMNYFLEALAGPRCRQLKVKNPDKYEFHPRKLLQQLITVYLHLGRNQQFRESMAREGRSYSNELMQRAITILRRESIVTTVCSLTCLLLFIVIRTSFEYSRNLLLKLLNLRNSRNN